MFKRALILNAAALALATAIAGQVAKAAPEVYTVTVAAGQGSPISFSVPVSQAPDAAAYARGGQPQTPAGTDSISVQPGEGSSISVSLPESNDVLAGRGAPATPNDAAPRAVVVAHAD